MPALAPTICGRCNRPKPSGARCTCTPDPRPSARSRGYTTAWDRERRLFLAKHPRCAHKGCSALATVVDHIIAHKGDAERFWNKENWQPLCAHHHNAAKQSSERQRTGGGIRASDSKSTGTGALFRTHYFQADPC